jgi:GDP/UDP-N,N'-diacetylbacillosamine 2-epimerase (hydrolysing)
VSRKICIVTGSRAEYGLLRWIMADLRDAPDLEVQVIATGMHLSPEFGLTYREIERDGFAIDRKLEILVSADTPTGLAKSMGLGLIGFGEAFRDLAPDVVVVLGDRFEILAAASAALVARIPVAHIHGGERTEGAFDEAIRHAVTKMSHIHFVAAEEYRRRVMQLGEDPSRIFLVGSPGLDAIARLPLLGRAELEQELGIALRSRNLLVTFHPATLAEDDAVTQLNELLTVLCDLEDTCLLFTMPNADTGGRAIRTRIEDFVSKHAGAHAFVSLGQCRYLSCLKHVDAVVGNSSSGLIEAPAFGIGTINIGDRQMGRLRAASVIDCEPHRASISAAFTTLYSPQFQQSLRGIVNPYGDGGASRRIVDVLVGIALDGLCNKTFFDLPLQPER